MNNSKRTQGFTLIELLIVIAIIGILAAVLIPNLLGAQKRAYDTGAQSCAKSIQTAEATFQIDKQAYFTINKTSAAAPALTAGTIAAAGAPALADAGLSSSCSIDQMRIVTTGAASGTTYTITVGDTRGSKTFTITPEALSSAGGAPS
ncbi:prepilin-type N-terminal cleavage/methylation domain-containing protein [Deinococcus maricopensis]|uniref:Pilin, type IV, putative n=1 Tax=Deinococcus maricopensis (strain DSM 21211 / LMG 22137 / NRRL B-23946 / LB-34) TaxID=709986 RepID=E8UAI4_DEIML|nr:prepilin-type N-terminal cleavage/methylation domain-containing protein [Deinococcus maricopensis]ADV68073.1 pilin, type IV, putative [Deinococcus maricopensis DSM 21211]